MIARQATPDDADELVRLRTVLLTSMNPPNWDDAWRAPTRETLIARLAHSASSAPTPPGARSASSAPTPAGARSAESAPTPPGAHSAGSAPTPAGARSASSAPTSAGACSAESAPTLAAFVIDRPDAPGLAACAVGTIEHRLGAPGDPEGRTGYVFSVATHPDMRRRGFSRECMTALLEWFRSQGVRKVDLRASAEAEPLYRSLGFTRTPDPAMRLRLDS